MLGAPASGKGTQAARLASHFGLPNLSTGSLIRGEQQRASKLGQLADKHLAGGGFLPDELMVEIISAWLSDSGARGFVLDGFPRTLPQAVAFDAILAEQGKRLDAVVLLQVAVESLHQRIASRVHCEQCGATTFRRGVANLASHSPCLEPRCRGTLAPRPDDAPGPFAGRLANFHLLTEPLIHHYDAIGVLKRVDGGAPSDEVFDGVLSQLGARTTTTTKTT